MSNDEAVSVAVKAGTEALASQTRPINTQEAARLVIVAALESGSVRVNETDYNR